MLFTTSGARRGAAAFVSAAVLWTATSALADQATISYGGKLYDKWYKVIKAPKPTGTHVSWPASNTKKSGDVTYRCKSCHGWDYLGKDGAYATGSYQTGIIGIGKYAGGKIADVIAVVQDKAHGFAGQMADTDLTALATFVTQGQIDMSPYIDRQSKKFVGDVTRGKEYYGTLCLNCHGADGKLPKDIEQLGKLSTGNPWEAMHKILNGQPGENMPALRALPVQVSADIGVYLQTLPVD